ncbi:MAG: 30S ribosomal protein S20 [Candidatus Omnitrophota bacterium]
MPHRRTSVKSQRQDKKRRLSNLKVKRDLKKTLKKLGTYLSEKNTVEAKTFLAKASSKLDKAAKKGIIKKNTASRRKSRLSKMLLKIERSNQSSSAAKKS